MTRRVRLVMVAAVAVMVLGVGAAGAVDPGAGVDTLNASVGATAVAVTGKATFIGPTQAVASDAAGDNMLPGTDLRSASITPASTTSLRFDVEVGDLPAPTGGTPEAVNYWWEFQVVRGASVTQFALQAWRTSTAADLTCGLIFACPPGEPGEPRFQLATCAINPDTGRRTCSAVAVPGALSGGVFSWTVPLAQINAAGGAQIVPVLDGQGNAVPIAASHGVSGVSWSTDGGRVGTGAGSVMSGDVMGWEGFAYQRMVELGIAPAATPDDEVPLTTPVASLSTSGSFAGSLPRPSQAGAYKVVARACLGEDNCGTASRVIQVP